LVRGGGAWCVDRSIKYGGPGEPHQESDFLLGTSGAHL
jgi:hypothetical protein